MTQEWFPPSRISVAFKRLKRDLEIHRDWSNSKSLFRAPLERTLAIRNSRAGTQLLIVANGRSAESLSPKFVLDFISAGGEVMGLNWAHLNPALREIPINLYLSADRRMLEHSDKSYALRAYLEKQGSLVGFVPEIRLKLWEDLVPGVTFIPFCRFYIKYLRLPWWGLKPIHPKPFTAQSGLHALQIATWLGYDRIFIIGFDNSYFREFSTSPDNTMVKKIAHAGEGFQTSESQVDTATYLETQASLFRDYWLFSSQPIYNLDPHSPTDAFKKVSLPSVLGEPTNDS